MKAHEPVFIDTTGWIALSNQDDALHTRTAYLATDLMRLRRPMIVADWVLAETGNGLARCAARFVFRQAIANFLAGSPTATRLINVDNQLRSRAIDLYTRVTDKQWELVDCASFLVMRDLHIVEALTADNHFQQAGYIALLK